MTDINTQIELREWIAPQVEQLDAGSAESSNAGINDGVGLQQS